jgi:YtkA-like
MAVLCGSHEDGRWLDSRLALSPTVRPLVRLSRSDMRSDILLATLFCVTTFTACHQRAATDHELRVDIQVSPKPVRVGPSIISIHLQDSMGKDLTAAAVTVEADMTHPGMSPVTSKASETKMGQYQAPVTFTMRGDWVLLIDIKTASGQSLERQVDIRGVGAAGNP